MIQKREFRRDEFIQLNEMKRETTFPPRKLLAQFNLRQVTTDILFVFPH